MRLKLSLLSVLGLLLFSQVLTAQSNPWEFVSKSEIKAQESERQIRPTVFKTVRLDLKALQNQLDETISYDAPGANYANVQLTLPLPDGSFQSYKIYEASIMHPDLQAKFPNIRSYMGVGIDDPSAYLRFSVSQKGFNGMVLTGMSSDIFIDPYAKGNVTDYIVYYKKDFFKDSEWKCHFDEVEQPKKETKDVNLAEVQGDCKLRTYDLALACTGEYATFHGGTVNSVMAAFNTTMTRVNGVTEKDLSMHFDLVANNNSLIYLNSGTDPYTNSNGGTMLGQNQTTCDNVIGSANYDIGHVFSTGGGGVAYLGCVCQNNNKAGGVTGQSSPVGDPFDIDYVAHEMGHQFGANHTQNNSCNRNSSTAMEPGSASTIMGYAGICTPNVQNNSDAYYHAISIQEIAAENTTQSCDVETTINIQPVATVPSNKSIPSETPFVLTGSATDGNPGDVLTYCWEQMDNQTASMPPAANNSSGPAFRSLDPTTSPSRYFPNLNDLTANNTPTWEVLTTATRTYNFRMTVRDNHPLGGCTDEGDLDVFVDGGSGPFLVTAPNTNVSWAGNSSQTVTWDVAGTNGAPVNCSSVDILLSTDGGFTFPTVLATATPNDGSQAVTIPATQTTDARIMVRGNGNIFFDISNTDFTISAPLNDFTITVSPTSQTSCGSANVTYTVNIGASGTFSGSVSLSTTGLPAGASASFSPSTVSAPGTSTMTLSGAPSGTNMFNIVGTASTGSQTKQASISVLNTPGMATLSSPANNAIDEDTAPTLTWNAVTGADDYDVDIASNATFTSIVASTTGETGTSWVPSTALNTNTQYYWRTRASNTCGDGAWSSTYTFTTANVSCTTFNSTNVGLPISSSGTPTITSDLIIPTSGTILDVNVVNLDIDHTYIRDLRVSLENPSGATERRLLNRPCGSENNIFFNSLDDEAASGSFPCPPNGGDYQPNETLSPFDGADMMGTWVLTIEDLANQDGGQLVSWGMEVCSTPPAAPTCTPAALTGVSALVLDSTKASVIWDATPLAGFFKIQYRVKGTSSWTLLNVPNKDYQRVAWIISGLTKNTTYEYRARMQCPDLAVGPYTSIQEFTTFTTSPCEIPDDSKIVFMSDPEKVRVFLDYEPTAERYDIRWRVDGTTGPIDNKITKKSITVLSGLTPSTTYEYRVRTKCSGVWTGYSGWTNFTTNDVPAPIAPPAAASRDEFVYVASDVNLYPNPTTDILWMQFDSEVLPTVVQVMSIHGKLIMEQTPSSTVEQINTADLSSGSYMVRFVWPDSNRTVQKFMKL